MYINLKRLYLQLAKWSIIMVISFTFGFIFIGTAFEYWSNDTSPVFLILAAGCVFLCLHYVKNYIYILRFKFLDDCFRADDDGSVPVQQVAEYLHTTPEKLERMRVYGEKRKILINLVYDQANSRFILTDRYKPRDLMKDRPFVGMNCPGCGANLKIRSGTAGICPYCDRQVNAPFITIG